MKKIAADRNYRMLKGASNYTEDSEGGYSIGETDKNKEEAIRIVKNALAWPWAARHKEERRKLAARHKEERRKILGDAGIREINNGNSFEVKVKNDPEDLLLHELPAKTIVLKSEL